MKIPEDNWRGDKTLKYEIPWTPPQSIIELDRLLAKNMSVLEFGSGGSTLFFSNRVKQVVSFENNVEWFNKITRILNDKNVDNVEMILFGNLRGIENKLPKQKFHCVMIDNTVARTGARREVLLEKSLPLLISPKIIVLDNWASPRHYPNSHMLHGWRFIKKFGLSGKSCVEMICDGGRRYGAKGTRIFYESSKE